MRIAPKPKEGHEMPLEDLLAGPIPADTELPKVIGIGRAVIEGRTVNYWTIREVYANKGTLDIDLAQIVIEKTDWTRQLQRAQAAEPHWAFRAPNAAEFYLIARYLDVHPDEISDKEYPIFNQAREFFCQAWAGGLGLMTSITYDPAGPDRIKHHPEGLEVIDMNIKAYPCAGVKGGRANIAAYIFENETDDGKSNPFWMLEETWTWFHGAKPKVRMFKKQDDPSYERIVMVDGGSINVRDKNPQTPCRTLLVRIKPARIDPCE